MTDTGEHADPPGEAFRAGSWDVVRARGTAGGLIDGFGSPQSRLVRLCDVTAPAFVLGSTQPQSDLDLGVAEQLGLEVCRRQSGGGGVLLTPGGQLWADLFLPAGDPLWSADVSRAFDWLGRAAAGAIEACSGQAASAHEGRLVRSRWSPLLCFAGLGPGEVQVGGRKVLGVSQRRTRSGASFHAMFLLRFDAAAIVTPLGLGADERREAEAELARTAGALQVDGAGLESALLEALSDL